MFTENISFCQDPLNHTFDELKIIVRTILNTNPKYNSRKLNYKVGHSINLPESKFWVQIRLWRLNNVDLFWFYIFYNKIAACVYTDKLSHCYFSPLPKGYTICYSCATCSSERIALKHTPISLLLHQNNSFLYSAHLYWTERSLLRNSYLNNYFCRTKHSLNSSNRSKR